MSYVLMSVCTENLENGVSKLFPNQTTLLGTSPGSVFVFSSGLKGNSLQASRGFGF